MSYKPDDGEYYIPQEIQFIQIRFFILGFIAGLIFIAILFLVSRDTAPIEYIEQNTTTQKEIK